VVQPGDAIQNPVTGERIVFLATSRQTHGEAVVIETQVQPGGFVAAGSRSVANGSSPRPARR
jgi:hypothetical protein